MVAAADEAVASAFRAKGWRVLTRGWPDLLCYEREFGKIMAVELKRGYDRMRPDQIEMQGVFTDMLSIPFHVAYDGEIGDVLRTPRRLSRAITPRHPLAPGALTIPDDLAVR